MSFGLLSVASPVVPAAGTFTLNGFQAEDYPFKNFFKVMGTEKGSPSSYAYMTNLDANGYPVSTPTSSFTMVAQLPRSYLGSWKIYGTGKCKFLMSPNYTGSTHTIVVTADPNSVTTTGVGTYTNTVTITTPAGNWSFTFNYGSAVSNLTMNWQTTANSFSGFTNIVMCRVSSPYDGDQAAIDSGILTSQFNDDFLTKVANTNCKTLRLLNWNDPDGSGNLTSWAYRIPLNYMSYSDYWIPGNIAANGGSGMTTTSADGVSYSISGYPNDPGNWTDGETIHVQWNTANTSTTPTFTVGARTAKTMVRLNASAPTVSRFAANAYSTLVYDQILDKVLVTVDNGDGSGGAMGGMIPYELCVALANKLNKNLWLQIPTHATLSCVQSLAAFVRDNLNSNLTAYFEYSNEIWNNTSGFSQTGWAVAYGDSLGFPSANNEDLHGCYGYKVGTFMPAIATVWTANGRPRSTLKCVMGNKCFGSISEYQTYRWNGTDLASVANGGLGNSVWVNTLGNPNFKTVGSRPIDVCDTIAYATYYSGGQCGNSDAAYTSGAGLSTGGPTTGTVPAPWTSGLLGAADAYALGTAQGIANGFAFLDWDFRQGTLNGVEGDQTLDGIKTKNARYSGWNTAVTSYNGSRPAGFSNITVECYEGGLEATYPTIQSGTVTITINSPSVITLPTNDSAIQANAPIVFATTGSLPTGLTAGTTYYIINRSAQTCNVAATPNGAAINTSGSQSGVQTCQYVHAAIPNITYAGAGGGIDTLLTAYKNNALAATLVQSQFNDFQSGNTNSSQPSWFLFNQVASTSSFLPSQWSLFSYDLYSTTFLTYSGLQTYHYP